MIWMCEHQIVGNKRIIQEFISQHVQSNTQKMEDTIQQFKDWFYTIPLVTRTYIAGSFILACGLSLGFLSPYSLYYTFGLTIFEFHLWRPITALLFQGKFSFSYLFSMFFCYFGLSKVQTDIFSKETRADFYWLCIYLYGCLLVIASIFPIYWLGDGFVFALIYIWCKRRPFEIIQLMYGIKVKSGYFPWVYMGFQVLMGASFYTYLIGLLIGHLYIAIKDIYLPRYHKDYLPTPQFFKRFVGGGVRAQAQRMGGNVFGGQGVRIQ